MALLVRLARQHELPEGGRIVKESHGRKIMLVRTRGQVYATDAHCFHMGGNLWEGDIEDVGGHACVVCPLHRYKIDMTTGQKVDTMLDGCVTCSSSQQQRTYQVYQDPDFICVHIPELHTQQPLPSDRYNQVAAAPPPIYQQQQAAAATTPTRGYGLLGSSSRAAGAAQEGLSPYSGFPLRRGLNPATPNKEGSDEPALQLSQEQGLQLSQQMSQVAAAAQQQQAMQPQQPAHFTQAQIPFAQSRVDTARIARRKAATAAIAARAYMPPSAPVQPPAAPQRQQGLARQTSGQQSLLNFGFTVAQRAATTGPDEMDMS